MQELQIIIRNKVGLHALPAALLIKTAKEYKSKISVSKGERVANAKNILTILALGVTQGTSITIRAEGEDEALAIDALRGLIENNFGEDDQ